MKDKKMYSNFQKNQIMFEADIITLDELISYNIFI